MDISDRIGAWLTGAGCFFRVWAPNARRVAVLIQDGPYWEDGDEIVQTGSRADAATTGAEPCRRAALEALPLRDHQPAPTSFSDSTRPHATWSSSGLTRQDPAAATARSSVDDDLVDWAPFETPRFENFLIYQCHVGSFAGRGDSVRQALGHVSGRREQARLHPRDGIQLHRAAARPRVRAGPLVGLQPRLVLRAGVVLRLAVQPGALRRQRPSRTVSPSSSTWSTTTPGPATTCSGSSTATPTKGGIYFEGGQRTDWGRGPAWWKREVQDFFYQNARMYFEQYHADGLRFDVTTQINGNHLKLVVDRLRQEFPDKYLIAEHLPDHPWIVNDRAVLRDLGRRLAPRVPAGTRRAGSTEQGEERSSAGTATTTPGTS